MMKTRLTENTYGKLDFKYRNFAKTTHLNVLLKQLNRIRNNKDNYGYFIQANINNTISNILAFNPTKSQISKLFHDSNNSLFGYKSFNLVAAKYLN